MLDTHHHPISSDDTSPWLSPWWGFFSYLAVSIGPSGLYGFCIVADSPFLLMVAILFVKSFHSFAHVACTHRSAVSLHFAHGADSEKQNVFLVVNGADELNTGDGDETFALECPCRRLCRRLCRRRSQAEATPFFPSPFLSSSSSSSSSTSAASRSEWVVLQAAALLVRAQAMLVPLPGSIFTFGHRARVIGSPFTNNSIPWRGV